MALEIKGPMQARYDEVLTADALELIEALHSEFDGRGRELLEERGRVQAQLDEGGTLDFPQDGPRAEEWTVPPAPPALADRRVEITGPTDRKTVHNALNSGP